MGLQKWKVGSGRFPASFLKNKTMDETKEEQLKVLDAEVKKAEEEGDEQYLEYIIRIRKMTININAGGALYMNSGSPPPLPPYK